MRRRNVFAALVVVAVVVLVPVSAQGANGHANYRAVCPGPTTGSAHCHALVVTDTHGNPRASSGPTGLDPATIQAVYGFPTVADPNQWSNSSNAGHGKTIAIVDAYDDPNAESDLAVFSSQYGLPDCTTSNGCFKKVNQNGGASYPRSNSGWALEISLDVQWAHAIAPGAKILLVEASSNSFANLLKAEDYAKSHANYVSNSWGGSEFSGEGSYDSHFAQSGVSFFVSAGDAGLPAEYPSASPNVISVGGTTLTFNKDGSLKSETGWSGGGGGCSAYEAATGAQAGFSGYTQVNCGGQRATPDVSLDADPSSGVSVYDSVKYYGQTGWWTIGGTSASSPMWAARAAQTGTTVDASYVYGSSINFRDITSGNNGAPCLVGFDLCTGRGSWDDGTGASSGGGSSQAADFTISALPPSQSVTAGASALYTVTVTPNSSFSGDVTLSLTAQTGITGTFAPNPTSSSSTLNVTTEASLAPSTYTLTITGSGDGVTRSTSVSLTVTSASVSPMSVSVKADPSTLKGPNYRVPLTVTATDGSSGIGGASVTVDVYSISAGSTTCSGPLAASGSGTTGSDGTVGFSFRTKATGSWCALATVSAAGYSDNSGQTTFTTPNP